MLLKNQVIKWGNALEKSHLLMYPIVTEINIDYSFESRKNIDQYINELSGLNDNNRYQQMVHTIADFMNSAFGKISKKDVLKTVAIVKYPLPKFGVSRTDVDSANFSASSNCTKPSMSSIGSQYERLVNYKADETEYKHCLDMEKIKAGGNLTDIRQNDAESTAKRKANNAEHLARDAEQKQQEAERKQQEAERKLRDAEQKQRDAEQKQRFNNIYK